MLRPDALRIKTHFSSSAAAAPGSLANNDDLLVEILVRLPIPSVLRFKSVSKRWLSLISDPNFSHRRITFYPPTPSGIFLTRHFWRPVPRGFGFVVLRPNPPKVPFESLEPSVPKRRIEILQSCNGLLLCCSYGRRYGKNTYYVYNPMTKQYTTLPRLQMSKNKVTIGPNLAYNPIRSSNYKVVCVRRLDSENFQIKIYSHDSGSWRSWCKVAFPFSFSFQYEHGVYWNGAVHWLTGWGNIVYLDMSEEKLHEMAIPCASNIEEYLGNCCEHLYWIGRVDQDVELIVFEMEDDRCGWFVKYRVDLQCVSSLFSDLGYAEIPAWYPKFRVIAIVDQSEVGEEPYVVLLIGETAVRVDANSGRFERLVSIVKNRRSAQNQGRGQIIRAHFYIESLACV